MKIAIEAEIWWYELHGANITIEGGSKEEIEKLSLNKLRTAAIEVCGDTFDHFGNGGVDSINETKDDKDKEIKLKYSDGRLYDKNDNCLI